MAKGRRAPSEFQDMGLGTTINAARMVNPDGSFNVRRKGMSFLQTRGIYHWLIRMPWGHFWLLSVAGYLCINLIFALLYMAVGTEHLDGMRLNTGWGKFEEAFFFSTQTFTTVGYGRVNPVGLPTNAIASLESMFGLMSFALGTGILYGRFSKPTVKILFSDNAIIAPYMDGHALMFRIANQRDNQLIEVEVSVSFSKTVKVETTKKRDYNSLQLERSKVNFFPLSWTLVHPLTEDSPLYGISVEDLQRCEAEIIILVKAFDDTFSQTVYTRSSYKAHEIISGVKFSNIFSKAADGATILELDRLSETEPVPMAEYVPAAKVYQERFSE